MVSKNKFAPFSSTSEGGGERPDILSASSSLCQSHKCGSWVAIPAFDANQRKKEEEEKTNQNNFEGKKKFLSVLDDLRRRGSTRLNRLQSAGGVIWFGNFYFVLFLTLYFISLNCIYFFKFYFFKCFYSLNIISLHFIFFKFYCCLYILLFL